jgi:hypothetical protein
LINGVLKKTFGKRITLAIIIFETDVK